MTDHKTMYAQECADIAAFLADLPADRWDVDSLCDGWKVRHVVGHMLFSFENGIGTMLGGGVRNGMNFDKFGRTTALARAEGAEPAELAEAFANIDVTGGFQKMLPRKVLLLDRMVHHQDIRRPLGMPRDVPADRALVALQTCVGANNGVNSKKHAQGLTIKATDIDFTHGSGPEVTGTAEALFVALSGRRHALADLSGDGAAELARRLG